ncbi:hypothetical protein EV178_002586 [Coemansia sp. RSA 1646]|nr:hypothetical protein EV178_002586 [Coemansia sp. RSA 1646]
MALQNLFVPRARMATFNVLLRIEDLNNVPPLNGVFYAKWRCQDHSGTTPRVPVANREVRWLHAIEKTVDVPISKDSILTPCELKVTIKQRRLEALAVIAAGCGELACASYARSAASNACAGTLGIASVSQHCMHWNLFDQRVLSRPGQGEVYSHMRMKVGTLNINLSEYALLPGSSRRYFLQESKLNCTLKLSIHVSQVSGPDSYQVPTLDRSMVLTDLNDMIANEGNSRAVRENSSMGNSLGSRQHSMKNNMRNVANSGSSVHTSTTKSNTTETSQSRALLPIDNTNVRDLAPFQRSSKKNQQIVDDVFFSSPGLPT